MAAPARPSTVALLLTAAAVVVAVALLAAPLGAQAKGAPARRRVRGVPPDLALRYEPRADGAWPCLDGSAVLPSFSRVNDDFCDCPDGSDEPGTSACPQGTFHCANRGHESRALSSAFVEDGVCDCCDGTDEAPGLCQNKCLEANDARRAALLKRAAEYRDALGRRAEAAGAAPAKRAEVAARAAAIGGELEAAAAALTAAEAEVVRADAEAARAQEERRQREEKEAADRAAAADAAAAAKAEEGGGGDEPAAAAEAAAEEPAAAAAAAGGGGDEGPKAEQQQQQQQEEEAAAETDEERGRRIAAQWTTDPDAAGTGAGGGAGSGSAKEDTAPAGGSALAAGTGNAGLYARLRSAVTDAVTIVATGGMSAINVPSSSSQTPGGGDEDDNSAANANANAANAAADEPWDEDPFGAESSSPDNNPAAEAAAAANPEAAAAAAAASALDSARDALRALERERDLLSRQRAFDFGADDAWLPLAGQCAEAGGGGDGHFTYRLCFFDAAAQVDGAGHETSLGRWQGIEVGEGHQGASGEAVFSGGDRCQNGPARSMRAKLVCGAEFKAWGASEPETCVYAATVSAPQACTEGGLRALEGAVASLEAEQRRLAEEIAADEAARRQEAAEGGGGGGGKGSGAPPPSPPSASSEHDEL